MSLTQVRSSVRGQEGDCSPTPWLIMLMCFFGKWPAWINFFVESCKWNQQIRWRIYTDCGEPDDRADNVQIIPVSFEDYKAFVRKRLGIAFDPSHPYKLCDLKPCLGFLHEQEVAGFPFFGYGDLDVIYGNISRFYGLDHLANFDVASTHPERLSGHFAVLRNTPKIRTAFERIPKYRELLELPQHVSCDENHFSDIFRRSVRRRTLSDIFRRSTSPRLLFVERHSTVLSPRGWHDGTMNYPQRWFWRQGHLTNERDGEREFLYLHFMRWQSTRWINDPPILGEAAWVGRHIAQVDWRRAAGEGFCISPEGFTVIR